MKRYQNYLDDAIKGIQQNNSLTNSPRLQNGANHHRTSVGGGGGGGGGGSGAEEESLSRSASDSSVANPTLNHNKQSTPGTPQLNKHGWVSKNSLKMLYFPNLTTFIYKLYIFRFKTGFYYGNNLVFVFISQQFGKKPNLFNFN